MADPARGDEEGYVKFRLSWEEMPVAIPPGIYGGLERWRERLYRAGVIGAYPSGIGFGNISHRADAVREARGTGVQFFITGSATGNVDRLGPEHYALVTGYSLERNTLSCRGLAKASSESLSHAAIYEALPSARAVIHIHSARVWDANRGRLPTTPASAEYGTPEMALALKTLATALGAGPARVIVMGGHEAGVIAFGRTLDEAGEPLERLLEHGPVR